MAKQPTTPAEKPEVVTLHSQGLGINKDFAPKHAQAILAFQEAKGITNAWTKDLPKETAAPAE